MGNCWRRQEDHTNLIPINRNSSITTTSSSNQSSNMSDISVPKV